MIHRSLPQRRGQRGISLIVSLVLLVMVTVVALASVRSVTLQTRMSAANQDRNLAFQAAETAMREAEDLAWANANSLVPASGCSNGYCAQTAPTATPLWEDSAFAGWRNASFSVTTGVATPQLVIEDMGTGENITGCASDAQQKPNCLTRRMRITTRSTADGGATVMLQGDFAASR